MTVAELIDFLSGIDDKGMQVYAREYGESEPVTIAKIHWINPNDPPVVLIE